MFHGECHESGQDVAVITLVAERALRWLFDSLVLINLVPLIELAVSSYQWHYQSYNGDKWMIFFSCLSCHHFLFVVLAV